MIIPYLYYAVYGDKISNMPLDHCDNSYVT